MANKIGAKFLFETILWNCREWKINLYRTEAKMVAIWNLLHIAYSFTVAIRNKLQ
jgi:hypothetical protein